MRDQPTIWHNPRCSKSRQTLELLHQQGYQPVEVDYLENPPTRQQIVDVLGMLNISARQLMRKGQDIYKELDLANENGESKLVDAMVLHPVLIERPVVIFETKAALGRPPESVLDIL